MKRKILLQLVLPLLGLIALFAMLAFAPNSAQRHPALLEMSVILREADSSILSTTRQGMEQAAADLNVELRFLSPTADNSAEEQIQLLQREVEAGASAILLIPADRTSMADAVSAAAAKSSLVTLETDMTAQGARGCISVDNAAVGQILGQAACGQCWRRQRNPGTARGRRCSFRGRGPTGFDLPPNGKPVCRSDRCTLFQPGPGDCRI